jgi:transcriptional regulator with XRE-family HTH domain
MKKEHAELLQRLRSSAEYWKRFSLLLFTTDIHRLMKNEPVPLSAAKLAQRIGVKPPVISNWLRGGENLTVETMSKIAAALDAAVYIHVAKKGVLVRWIEEQAGNSMRATITLGGVEQKTTATQDYAVPGLPGGRVLPFKTTISGIEDRSNIASTEMPGNG